jgi:hypothetical protein
LFMTVEGTSQNKIYSLIPLEDFKAVLGIDDREDKLARFCLVTSTCTIEEYCKRRLLRKKHFEWLEYIGDLTLPLREYPVSQVLSVNLYGNGEILEPDFYNVIPDCGTDYDLPFKLLLSRAIQRQSGISAIKAVYWAGYSNGLIPADLSAACLELASWNMNRYRGRRIGMTGNVRGGGKDGEHFEMSMPENVKQLLEPHRRKTI